MTSSFLYFSCDVRRRSLARLPAVRSGFRTCGQVAPPCYHSRFNRLRFDPASADWRALGGLLQRRVRERLRDQQATMPKQSDSAPEFVKCVGPVIAALGELGGSGRPEEVRDAIARALSISEEEQARLLPSGVQSRYENQVHWARFYLAKGGYIDASRHGVWTLTDKARALGKVSASQAREIYRAVAVEFGKSRGKTSSPVDTPPGADERIAPTTEAEHTFISYRGVVAAGYRLCPPQGLSGFLNRLFFVSPDSRR